MITDDLNIIITTFEKRYELLKQLIKSIRDICNNKIIIVVNGEVKSQQNNEYIKNILSLSIDNFNIIPIIFPNFTGLSRLWNTGCLFSDANNLLILNDDTNIKNITFLTDINNSNLQDIHLFNNSFSHFLINKTFLIEEMNFFDERFMGIGWEDSDFSIRYYQKYKKIISCSYISSIHHSRDKNFQNTISLIHDKYSMCNRIFFETKYGKAYGAVNEFTQQFLSDINPYPLINYINNNKNKL